MGYLGAWERPSDPASGLIQMGARSYDPSLGSFASEDPVLGHLGIGVSVNRYPYVWDNPLNRYDLNGRDACLIICAGEVRESVEGLPGEFDEGWEQIERAASGTLHPPRDQQQNKVGNGRHLVVIGSRAGLRISGSTMAGRLKVSIPSQAKVGKVA